MEFNNKLLFRPLILKNILKDIKFNSNNLIYIPFFSLLKHKLKLKKTITFNNDSFFNKNNNFSNNLIYNSTRSLKFDPNNYCTLNQSFKFNISYLSNKNINLNKKCKFLNNLEKMKNLWEKYGYISVFTYFTIYLVTFTSFLVLAINNILNASKIIKMISILKLDNHINSSKIERKMETPFGKLFLAWISTKIVEPIRLFSTILFTPYIYKILKR